LAIFGVPGGAPSGGVFLGFSGCSGPPGWGGIGLGWGGIGLGWVGVGLEWGGVGLEWGGVGLEWCRIGQRSVTSGYFGVSLVEIFLMIPVFWVIWAEKGPLRTSGKGVLVGHFG